MSKAAKFLTPLLLELGGKNPVIIDETADVDKAVRQTLFARTVNCGQMCVAPDYVLCHEDVMEEFVERISSKMNEWFHPESNGGDYDRSYVGKLVNRQQFERVVNMLRSTKGKVVCGGSYDEETLMVEPTVIVVDEYEDEGMKQETFGPLLWVKRVKGVEEAVEHINSREKSLSLYMFSSSSRNQQFVVNNTSSGGMQINGAIAYLGNPNLGFGGVGSSGMGAYHGDRTFYTFSHTKAVVQSLYEQRVLYPPRNGWKLKLIPYI